MDIQLHMQIKVTINSIAIICNQCICNHQTYLLKAASLMKVSSSQQQKAVANFDISVSYLHHSLISYLYIICFTCITHVLVLATVLNICKIFLVFASMSFPYATPNSIISSFNKESHAV